MWKLRPSFTLAGLLFLQLAFSISTTFCPHIFSELNTFSVFVSHLCDCLLSKYLSRHLLSSFHRCPITSSVMQRQIKISRNSSTVPRNLSKDGFFWCSSFWSHLVSLICMYSQIIYFLTFLICCFVSPLLSSFSPPSLLHTEVSPQAAVLPSAFDIFRMRRTCENSVFIVPLIRLIIQTLALTLWLAIWSDRPAQSRSDTVDNLEFGKQCSDIVLGIWADGRMKASVAVGSC